MKKIKVENLGVIKEGTVDVGKPLTIFTGLNNSGKSYMAYLVYGCFSAFHPEDDNLSVRYSNTLLRELKEDDVFNEYLIENGISFNHNDFIVQKFTPTSNQILGDLLENNISDIFASNFNVRIDINIVFSFVEIAQSFIEDTYGNILEGIEFDLKIDKNDFTLLSKVAIGPKIKESIKRYLEMSTIPHNNTYFFPAERSAIHLFSKEIFKQKAAQRDELAKVIQNGNDIENAIKTFQKNGALIPRYPLAVNDYLTFTSDFEYFVKQPKTEFEDLAKELETILGGRISVNPYGSLEFKPKGTRKNLPLHLSSSMVKSLGGLVVYLRHLAREHDHIIIDEPELNLHPSTQVRLARLLAKIANRGIKLLISTHSDYIISELSNLMLMSNDFKGKKALQKKYSYKKDDFIKGEDVNVYAFQNETIEQVPITEQGIEIDKIRKVIADMNLRSDDIYYIHLDSLEDASI